MRISGVLAPPPTPMNASGDALHLDAIAPLTELLISTGVDGLFVNGTTGEGSMLSLDERRATATAFVDASSGRVPVVVQVGTASTRDSIALAEHAEASGANAIAVVAPYFFGHDQAALKHHVRAVAAATQLPLFAYDIPSRTQNSYTVDTLRELFSEGAIVGAKDSSGDFARLLDLLDIEGFVVLPGSDIHIGQLVRFGAAGAVTGPGTLFPEPYTRLVHAARDGDDAGAAHWQGVVTEVSRMFAYGADLPLLKCVLGALLPGMGGPRAPHAASSPARVNTVLAELERIAATHDLPTAQQRFATVR